MCTSWPQAWQTPGDRGAVGHVLLVRDRQRVEVGAQPDEADPVGRRGADIADQADPVGQDHGRQPGRLEVPGDQPGGAVLLAADLRVGVDLAPQRHQLVLEPLGHRRHPGGQRRELGGDAVRRVVGHSPAAYGQPTGLGCADERARRLGVARPGAGRPLGAPPRGADLGARRPRRPVRGATAGRRSSIALAAIALVLAAGAWAWQDRARQTDDLLDAITASEATMVEGQETLAASALDFEERLAAATARAAPRPGGRGRRRAASGSAASTRR